MSKINDINDLVNATFQVKKFFRDTKKKFNLNYEEIYILNHILRSESNESSSKEIAKCSEFKPYYLTKALQKLKDLKLLSKKRSLQDERTVIVYVTDTQKANIQKLISELEEYIKN
ncbi:HTH-type transcriptional regulator SarR [Staphylococcus aureus]|uniref:HTH-type transcriptional regulator SarR n=1 Tax=Staphylococcus aureus TaxID=1280 RepID=UPI0038B24746